MKPRAACFRFGATTSATDAPRSSALLSRNFGVSANQKKATCLLFFPAAVEEIMGPQSNLERISCRLPMPSRVGFPSHTGSQPGAAGPGGARDRLGAMTREADPPPQPMVDEDPDSSEAFKVRAPARPRRPVMMRPVRNLALRHI